MKSIFTCVTGLFLITNSCLADVFDIIQETNTIRATKYNAPLTPLTDQSDPMDLSKLSAETTKIDDLLTKNVDTKVYATREQKKKALQAVFSAELIYGEARPSYLDGITTASDLYGHCYVLEYSALLAREYISSASWGVKANTTAYQNLFSYSGLDRATLCKWFNEVQNQHKPGKEDRYERQKPLCIYFHGMDGNSGQGDAVRDDFFRRAQAYYSFEPLSKDSVVFYSPAAPNGRWFHPEFMLSHISNNSDAMRLFMDALYMDSSNRICVKKMFDQTIQREILNIIDSLNPIKDQIRRVIGTHPLSKVVLTGHSMGGIVAWFLANQLSHSGPYGRIGALITDSSPFFWLTNAPLPKYIRVNTPSADNFFAPCFDECWRRLNSKDEQHSRFADTSGHGEMSDAFKQGSALVIVSVLRDLV